MSSKSNLDVLFTRLEYDVEAGMFSALSTSRRLFFCDPKQATDAVDSNKRSPSVMVLPVGSILICIANAESVNKF